MKEGRQGGILSCNSKVLTGAKMRRRIVMITGLEMTLSNFCQITTCVKFHLSLEITARRSVTAGGVS